LTPPAGTPSVAGRIYKLPYANSVVDSLLEIAEKAQQQACVSEQACKKAMYNNENTMSTVLPAYPQAKDGLSNSIIYSTRSLMLSAEAAYQAQASVCEALAAASKAATDERNRLSQRIDDVCAEITALDNESAALRAAFASITEGSRIEDAYATAEAKKLLATLEIAYQKHDLNRRLHQGLSETEANIDYLSEINVEARRYLHEIEALSRRAKDEWQRIVELFHIDQQQLQQLNDQTTPAMRAFSAGPAKKQEIRPITPAAPEQVKGVEQESIWAVVWSYVKIIIIAFLVAFVLRAYVFDITIVDGTSMYPTLEDRDSLVTAKIPYLLGEPQRGDIVVLQAPDLPGEDYIKRVIGLPNEELLISEGKVYVDGVELEEAYLGGVETDGDVHMIIPDGFYFVMGDNRADSRDSRLDSIGVINRDSISGKAVFRLLPLSNFGKLE